MSRIPSHEHHRLLQLIEQMQRDGKPEPAIHEAVRQASGPRRTQREQPARRPRSFALFVRHHRR